ncbi:UNVERIFIED_CONTAM: putative UDP-glucuronate:xylan alpha-glucuronosyltransferase 3 [Sesamum calycinum]|uniref:Hexosyltransferase n=1 Tax=Sesamum calycinum TaxID=2727403 RepID=A0AAW2J793_9LAMI
MDNLIAITLCELYNISCFHEDTNKRRFLRNRALKDGDRSLYLSSLDRIFSCKFPTLKLVMVIIVIGAFFTLLRSPSIHETDHISGFHSRSSLVDKWIRDRFGIDQSYASTLEINWDEIADAIEKLTDRDEYKGIGLVNFSDQELDQWKELLPDAEHVILMMDYAPHNVTWETLYPEWLDEEEEFEIPTCPTLPKIHFPGKPRLDLIVVKLPCDKSRNWSRDVARLHLQLEAARLAATAKGYHPVHVLLITECFPTPNLFTCKDLIAKENWHSGNARREAYATILHSAHVYVCGAIAAAQSIRMAGSTRDLVILVDETISDYHRGGLEAAGWKIHTIQRIRNPKAERDAYNEWNYSKFRLWQLTDYDKIIFIDADLLVLRNIDFLFEMPEISATGNNATLFNSGVMVIEPSNCTFQLLMEHINEIESYNGGDQEKKEMSDPPVLYVLHYLGLKPWLCFRDYDCNWNVDILQEFASDVAHRTWWKVHDAMPENLQKYCLLRSKQKAALEWDRRQAEKGNYSDGHWKIKIQDPRLTTCFEEFCFWESMLWHWGETNWTDNGTSTQQPPAIETVSLSSL